MFVFVGGSSRDTNEKCFVCAAQSIGEFIADKGHNLVFGGCNKGLMGETYRKAIKGPNSKVYAILASEYEDDLKEIEYHTAYLMDTINQRKDAMLKLADAAVFLPGGIGTIDEIMTTLEAIRAKQYSGKMVILNLGGYYDHLIHQLSYARWKGFSEEPDVYCRIFNNVSDAIHYLDDTV